LDIEQLENPRELATMEECREFARELYVGCGVRSAIRIQRKMVEQGYPEIQRGTIQQWIGRGAWANEYERYMREHFPVIMRETAGNLVLAAMHASRKLLELEASDMSASKERIAQMALAIDRGGFGHVGESKGLNQVTSASTSDQRSIHRWLTQEQMQEIITTGNLIIDAEVRAINPPVNPLSGDE
jgi:hypothetical protein